MRWPRELAAARLPILLGGDHCLTIGAVTAVARHCGETEAARACCGSTLIPTSTPPCRHRRATARYAGGVPLRSRPAQLTALSGAPRPVDPRRIRQIGIRRVDAVEKRLCRKRSRRVRHAAHRRTAHAHAWSSRWPRWIRGTHLHVSFDVDFLDPEIAPGVRRPCRRTDLSRVAIVHGDDPRQRPTGVARRMELNPAFDEGNRTASLRRARRKPVRQSTLMRPVGR